MFDKLIESDSKGAEFKARGRYFIVSSLVVGSLFLSAVMFSLFAAEIGLGSDEFELSAMLAPPPNDAPEPKEPKQQTQQQAAANKSEVTTRQANMQRPDEVPTKPPTKISSVPSTTKARPEYGNFEVTDGPERDAVSGAPQSNGWGKESGTPDGTTAGTGTEAVARIEKLPPPPVVVEPKASAPKGPISLGVINGKAMSLPKPAYPAPAIMANAEGNVIVQVMIDESGKVVSSKAVSGHPLLKGAAERAAMNARFTPTLLSKVPVKVTGVIVYKFSRG
ncbi:MAG: TonB family protein [Pyrinomonadaceae bacterium]